MRPDNDAVGDACEAGDVARDFERAPALAGRLGLTGERDDASLDLLIEVSYPQPLGPLQLGHPIPLEFRVRSHRTAPFGWPTSEAAAPARPDAPADAFGKPRAELAR